MIAHRNFEHCEPLTWVGRMPVYLATVLAAAHAVAMILTAFAFAVNRDWTLVTFGFSPTAAVLNLHLWQFVTYAFVNPPGIMAAIQIILLAKFGGEVEKLLGRKSFAFLYGTILLAIPLFLTILGRFGFPSLFAGSDEIHFAIFIAFVLLYPTAEIFFSIQARWIGLGLFAVATLQYIAFLQWAHLAALWLACAIGAVWLMREGLLVVRWPAVASPSRPRGAQKKFRVMPKEELEEDPPVHESVDPILEKIARQGIGSLTRAERERLERARATLLKKESDK